MSRISNQWMFRTDGIGDVHRPNTQCATFCQPVVVLSPEDREQVERLMAIYEAIPFASMDANDQPQVTEMQAALREFANPTPPKPDEPMGLGAVVSTESDGDYIHVSLEHARPWLNVQTRRSFRWDDVAAVRILSEGVQP